MSTRWQEDNKKMISDQLYSGAADFGYFMAKVGAAIGTIIGLLMIGFGLKMYFGKEEYDRTTNGRVVDAQCAPIADGKGNFQCYLKIEYFVDGKSYIFETSRSDKFYTKGIAMDLRYKSASPQDATMAISSRTGGLILAGIGLFILVAAWVTLYIKYRFKFAAAAGGVGTAWDMIN